MFVMVEQAPGAFRLRFVSNDELISDIRAQGGLRQLLCCLGGAVNTYRSRTARNLPEVATFRQRLECFRFVENSRSDRQFLEVAIATVILIVILSHSGFGTPVSLHCPATLELMAIN
jgi:hypothetical protein